MQKKAILILFTFALASCLIASAYAWGSSTSVFPNPAIPNSPVTATWTAEPGNPSTKVTFVWKDNTGAVVFTDPDRPVSGGKATSQYTLPADAEGTWQVEATASGVTGMISFEIAPFLINVIPEIPILGSLGAVVAMSGALVYKTKKNNKTQ